MNERPELPGVEQEECGFCEAGTYTHRGRSQPCPYCGGSGQMAVIGIDKPCPSDETGSA